MRNESAVPRLPVGMLLLLRFEQLRIIIMKEESGDVRGDLVPVPQQSPSLASSLSFGVGLCVCEEWAWRSALGVEFGKG